MKRKVCYEMSEKELSEELAGLLKAKRVKVDAQTDFVSVVLTPSVETEEILSGVCKEVDGYSIGEETILLSAVCLSALAREICNDVGIQYVQATECGEESRMVLFVAGEKKMYQEKRKTRG